MRLPKPPPNPWKQKSSRQVYKNAWIRVREDKVIRPDGKQGIYGVVEIAPAVVVVPIRDDGKVLLLGQWRYVLGRYSWEPPNGGTKPGEAPRIAARRELREEGGLLARRLVPLGTTDQSNGVTTDVGHLYLGLSLKQVSAQPDQEEQFQFCWVPLKVAIEMAVSGKITEGLSVAALLRASFHPEARKYIS